MYLMDSNEDKDPILSLQEACDYVKVKKDTLFRAVKIGDLKAYRKGQRYYFLRSDLRKYLLSDPVKIADEE